MASNILTGQVYGTVDWISDNKREAGMYLRTSAKQTQCILYGAEIERQLSNGVLAKGMPVTGFGALSGRSIDLHGEPIAEITCNALSVTAEAVMARRIRGAAYANLKGVVMYWDASKMLLKTFFNYNEPGKPKRMVCSVHMKHWVAGMPPESQQPFIDSIRKGREFTVAANVETARYWSPELESDVPVLQLLPMDFRLQG